MVAIPGAALANFERFKLGEIFPQIVPELSCALKCAVATVESGCDPTIYNYYDEHGVLHDGHWDGTGSPPDRVYAIGLLQCLKKYPRGRTVRELFDPTEECRAILPELLTAYHRAWVAGLRGADAYALVYFAHNQGCSNAWAGLARAKVKTIESVIEEAPYMATARKPKALAFAKHVADLVPIWEAALASRGHVTAPVTPVEEWCTLESRMPDEQLCTLDPMYPGGAPMCMPPELLQCLPDEGEMSYGT